MSTNVVNKKKGAHLCPLANALLNAAEVALKLGGFLTALSAGR